MYKRQDFIGAHLRHLWRREVSEEEMLATGARIWNLGRLLNLREGLRRRHDRLPARILRDAHPDGASAGHAIGAEAFEQALDEYYRVRGWDADGVPLPQTLERLAVDVEPYRAD